MTTIGYARVSTDSQTLSAQQAALQSAGCERVFAEKQSGAKTDRAQLAKAMASLVPGDTLVVCKLDRLARSTRDLLNTLAAVADAGATFKSLGDPWCDYACDGCATAPSFAALVAARLAMFTISATVSFNDAIVLSA
jgi:DNA invertase Pin-like site-specific DNA recombinase